MQDHKTLVIVVPMSARQKNLYKEKNALQYDIVIHNEYDSIITFINKKLKTHFVVNHSLSSFNWDESLWIKIVDEYYEWDKYISESSTLDFMELDEPFEEPIYIEMCTI